MPRRRAGAPMPSYINASSRAGPTEISNTLDSGDECQTYLEPGDFPSGEGEFSLGRSGDDESQQGKTRLEAV